MPLKQRLLEIAKTLPVEALTFKEYGKANRKMATTRTINVIDQGPVPGQPGMVGRYQVTFCVNIMDIAKEEDYKNRVQDTAASALAALDPEARQALLAQYANE
jgi:hypothetical protein